MITMFAGTPGSGKSYEAVKRILEVLQKNCHILRKNEALLASDKPPLKVKPRKVYARLDGLDNPVCREFIKIYTGLTDLELFEYLLFLEHKDVCGAKEESKGFWDIVENGSLIVIDEVHRFFSNRHWQTLKNQTFNEWTAEHRHLGIDCIFITQDTGKVDSQSRTNVEWSYVFRKINFFGSAVTNKYLCYAYASDETTGQPVIKEHRTYDHKIFQCYKSYVADEIAEQGFMKHANILMHPIFLVIPVVLAGFLYLLFGKSSLASGDLFGAKSAMAKAENSGKVIEKRQVNDKSSISGGKLVSDPAPASSVSPVSISEIEDISQDYDIIEDSKIRFSNLLTRLNFISFDRPGDDYVRIMFRGGVYRPEEFPYEIVWRKGQPFCYLPLDG